MSSVEAKPAADQLKAAAQLNRDVDCKRAGRQAALATPPTVRCLHRALLVHCPGQLRRNGDGQQLGNTIVGLPVLLQPVTELPACTFKVGRPGLNATVEQGRAK
jgi:hypothetical protein